MKLVTSIVVVAALLLPQVGTAAGMAAGDVTAGVIEPTLDSIQVNLFTPSCAISGCHGAPVPVVGLSLVAGDSYANLVNVPSAEFPIWDRVEPFTPDQSYLICKIEACSEMVGVQMPPFGGPLDPGVIAVVREWIENGAMESGSIAVEGSTWGRVKARWR